MQQEMKNQDSDPFKSERDGRPEKRNNVLTQPSRSFEWGGFWAGPLSAGSLNSLRSSAGKNCSHTCLK
jgi:hypothetical protein